MSRLACSYDCAADMWSFGMTLLELATGQAPYASLGLDQILMKTMNEDAPRLERSNRRQRFSEVRSPKGGEYHRSDSERWRTS